MRYKPIENRRFNCVISKTVELTVINSFVWKIFREKNRRLTAVKLPINRNKTGKAVIGPANWEFKHG